MALEKVAEFEGRMPLKWSPDGRYLATGHEGQTRVWDVASSSMVCAVNQASMPLAWSPDGRHLVVGTGPTIQIWDAAEGALRQTLERDSHKPWLLRWSPGGRLLTTGGTGTVEIWNPLAGELIHALASPDAHAVQWSSDGRYLHTNGNRGILVWDAANGARQRKFGGRWRRVRGAEWSPQGHRLAVAGRRSTLIWDPGTDTMTSEIPDTTRWPRWSRDGRMLAAGANPVRVWEIETCAVVRSFDGSIPSGPLWSPDERQVATSIGHGVTVWDMESGELLRHIGGGVQENVNSVRWSADSRHIVAHASDLHRDPDRTVRTYTMTHPTGVMLHLYGGPIGVDMSPDGRLVAITTSSRIQIWSLGQASAEIS